MYSQRCLCFYTYIYFHFYSSALKQMSARVYMKGLNSKVSASEHYWDCTKLTDKQLITDVKVGQQLIPFES